MGDKDHMVAKGTDVLWLIAELHADQRQRLGYRRGGPRGASRDRGFLMRSAKATLRAQGS